MSSANTEFIDEPLFIRWAKCQECGGRLVYAPIGEDCPAESIYRHRCDTCGAVIDLDSVYPKKVSESETS